MKILFLCTGNSCRSILAEALFNHKAPIGWQAMSAGSQPTGTVNPYSLKILENHGIDATELHSKTWNDLPKTPDIVITVCASAAGETCPLYLGKAVKTHWGLSDPADATGSEQQILAVFESTYASLSNGIEAFLDLPLATLADDPQQLKIELDLIGQNFFNQSFQ